MNQPGTAHVARWAITVFVLLCVVFSPIVWILSAESPQGTNSEPLSGPSNAEDDRQTNRVLKYHLRLEVRGRLLWRAGQRSGETPVEVTSEQTYYERIVSAGRNLPTESVIRSAARYYESAKATYNVGGQTRLQELSEKHRLLFLDLMPQGLRAYSPYEPIDREELDLVDVPGCSMICDWLLPPEALRPELSWNLDDASIGLLLGVSRVTKNSVVARCDRVENSVAVLHFGGQVAGQAQEAETSIDVEGKANVDVVRRIVTWLALDLREKRQISELAPGFEIQARLRMAARDPLPSEKPSTLGDDLPARLSQQAVPLVRTMGPEGKWQLLHESQWWLIVARHDVTILRLFDEGQFLGQLIIATLPDAPAGRHIAAQTFQEEILATLKEHSGQILETQQGENEHGVRVLRATASGVVGETPMHWIFYHLSDDFGRRVGMSFSVAADNLERFAERDRVLVETFSFAPPPASVAQPATPVDASPQPNK
jgi:hypothetical protein